MNLYLYLLLASAHPPGCIKGTVYGLIKQYFAQNIYRTDYIHFVILLYRRLLDRGWEREFMRGLILEATSTIENKQGKKRQAPAQARDEEENRIFLHLQYHPDDISRQEIQQEYERHCGEFSERAWYRSTNDRILKAKKCQQLRDSSQATPSSWQTRINNYGGVWTRIGSLITPPIFSQCVAQLCCLLALRENLSFILTLFCHLSWLYFVIYLGFILSFILTFFCKKTLRKALYRTENVFSDSEHRFSLLAFNTCVRKDTISLWRWNLIFPSVAAPSAIKLAAEHSISWPLNCT